MLFVFYAQTVECTDECTDEWTKKSVHNNEQGPLILFYENK